METFLLALLPSLWGRAFPSGTGQGLGRGGRGNLLHTGRACCLLPCLPSQGLETGAFTAACLHTAGEAHRQAERKRQASNQGGGGGRTLCIISRTRIELRLPQATCHPMHDSGKSQACPFQLLSLFQLFLRREENEDMHVRLLAGCRRDWFLLQVAWHGMAGILGEGSGAPLSHLPLETFYLLYCRGEGGTAACTLTCALPAALLPSFFLCLVLMPAFCACACPLCLVPAFAFSQTPRDWAVSPRQAFPGGGLLPPLHLFLHSFFCFCFI